MTIFTLVAVVGGLSVSAGAASPEVTLDTPPPLGSNGWFDSTGSITSTYGGDTVTLSLYEFQSSGVSYPNGTYTLTWNPNQFSYVGQGDSSAVCDTSALSTGTVSCRYTDLDHGSGGKGVGYTFTAIGSAPNASVKASLSIEGGGTATEKFPLAIQAPVIFDQSSGWATDTVPYGVTSASAGQTVTLSFGEIQPDPTGVADYADGTFSLTWSTNALTYVGNGDTSAGCGAGPSGPGSLTCSYTDLAHGSGGKDDSFVFVAANGKKAVHAKVVATVTINGYSVSYDYPIVVQAA